MTSLKMKSLLLFSTVLSLKIIFSASSQSTDLLNLERNIDDQLPTTIVPELYIIRLYPSLDPLQNFTFDGKVKMKTRVNEATNRIVLHHSKSILIKKISVINNEKIIGSSSDTYDEQTEKHTFILNTSLPTNSATDIEISYNGFLAKNMRGFYVSHWKSNGTHKYAAATQFHSIFARHAFPCFDEPQYKANFTIVIWRPKTFTSLSNMPINITKPLTEILMSDTFQTSIPMSTYLVAFFVSEFDYLDLNKEVKVWAQPEAVEQTKYASHIGLKARDFFSTHFEENYELPKADMVAIPDMIHTAMENWGLITFRENTLLYHINHTSDIDKQTIATTIIHEWTHMWFGNLVTPESWGCVWLSEGFATYFQHYATATIEPTWNMDQQIIIDQLQPVLLDDAMDSSKPMTRIVKTAKEIKDFGGTIPYNKGSSIIRMMNLSFGPSIFNAALKRYIKLKKYQTANPDDLWSSFQNEIDGSSTTLPNNVKVIMDSWTIQAGLPVVNVTIENGIAKLHQERFFIRNLNSASKNITWFIPLTWTTLINPDFDNTAPKYWFSKADDEINLKIPTDECVIFNIQQAGYYRVNYDRKSWYRIIDTLNSDLFEIISPINRAAIIDDLLNLARAGILSYEDALNGVKYIKREKHYFPIKSALTGLKYLQERFADQEHDELINNYILSLITPIYKHLGYIDASTDDQLTKLLRKELNQWACNLGHTECNQISLEYYSNWAKNQLHTIPKNQRSIVYCEAVKYNDTINTSNAIQLIINQYKTSISATERSVALESLSCISNAATLTNILESALDDNEQNSIRKQDNVIFKTIAKSNSANAEFMLNFIANHHKKMITFYGDAKFIGEIISAASEVLTTPDGIKKLEAFITNHNGIFDSISDSLSASLDIAKFERKFYEKNYKDIVKWITNYNAEINKEESLKYRLPDTIIPKSYSMKLTPHIFPGSFTFDGSIEITTTIAKNTTEIVLHADNITSDAITLTVNGKHVQTVNITHEETYQFLRITAAETMTSGSELIITITYVGYLNDEKKGFYRGSYVDDLNQTKWFAATQFQPTAARKMFPCFDEPALKATFQINVSRLAEFHSLSNTPLKLTIQENDRYLDIYERTPIMSTYLVAVIVSNFNSTGLDANHLAWTRPNAIDEAKYASGLMIPVLNFFEKALKSKYHLPKLDMVALPGFGSGAMENWGLITYRESRMLYNPDYSTLNSKQTIAYSIAHEIAHQWFGNLVSPHWWKDVWISEGLAQYFQYATMSNLEPTWRAELQIIENIHLAFLVDSLPSSNPLSHDVYSPAEIKNIFNFISYGKGASILRMIEKIFGSDLFYASLSDYLNAKQYQSARPDDLYYALQRQINTSSIKLDTSIKTIMDSWVTQAGFPVLNVKVDKRIATLSQERFLSNNPDEIPINKTWWIPITWTSKNNPNFLNITPKYWLNKSVDSIEIESIDDNNWIIFNVQQTGYYRVNYDNSSWYRIIKLLNSQDYTKIHEINRASILDDLFNLARVGYADYGTALSATQYLSQEINYIPWEAAFHNFYYLYKKLTGSDISNLYHQHILTVLQPIYDKLEFEEKNNDSHLDKLLRSNVVSWACRLNHTHCIQYSLKIFNNWKSNSSKVVPVNLRSTIYCAAIKWGSSDNWEFLWNKYLQTNSAREKNVIIQSLGCTKMRDKIHKLLINAITINSGIAFQDSLSVFMAVYTSGLYGVEETLNFISNNFENMYNYYKDYRQIEDIFGGMLFHLMTKEVVSKFEEFVKTSGKKLSIIEVPLKKYVTQARNQLNWLNIYSPRIFEWLSTTYPDNNFRLPKTIIPIHYEIHLIPYLEDNNFTFDGIVNMTLNVINSTSSIVLHANQLNISEIQIYLINTAISINVSSYTFGPHHKFNIYLKTIIEAGSQLTMYIKYRGVLNNKMEGFYRSYYKDDNGNIHWLATTQFQKYGARQAFPCFDEPALKAKFNISIMRPNNYHTLSNMKLSSSLPSSTQINYTWDNYEETKLMSSYLVAFIISDFASTINFDNTFRVWSRPNAIIYANNSLEVGQKSLKFLEEYTGISYPISKMDFAAIPDFAVGAMENWGLVTFREYGLLSDNYVTPTHLIRSMETTIAHEIAHMWFGNLVTCDWWEYVWLNEGFAQYFKWFVMDFLQPQSRLMDQFIVYEVQVALLKDSFAHMRPMNNKMKDPYDDGKDFSAIAYSKSSSIIRMMQHAFGNEVFHKALKYYLQQNQYNTSIPSKLWSAIEITMREESGLQRIDVPIATLMESWTNQSGYPVVQVNILGNELTLVQERFCITGKNTSLDELYWIPITIATKSNPNFSNTSPVLWLGSKGMVTSIANVTNGWIILNVQQTGFYRVNYDLNIWNDLIETLNHDNYGGIPEINRAQIIDDLLNLARGDYVSYHLALSATQYLSKEKNHLPWTAFLNSISFIYERFNGHSIEISFKKYLLKLISPIFMEVGFEEHTSDTQLNKLNRYLILSWACKVDHPDCVILSRKVFNEWRANSAKRIPPDAIFAVFCTALKYGDYDDWLFLWQEYRGSNLESEKIVMLQALGCSQNKTAIDKYLSHAISRDGSIRDQHVKEAFSSVYSAGKYGVDASLDFLINNYLHVHKYYGSWDPVAQLFSSVAEKISMSAQISKLFLFVENNKEELANISKNLKESMVSATENKKWYDTHVVDIESWLISKEIISTTEFVDTGGHDAAIPIYLNKNVLGFSILTRILILLL